MRDMKFANWNTNQRSRGKAILKVVSDEVIRLELDAFVFTEFLNGSNEGNRRLIQELATSLNSKYDFHYNIERKECAGQNGILIGVRKKFEGEDDTVTIRKIEEMETKRKEQPNFLQVDMVVNGKPLTIIGTRIRVTKFTERREQLLALTDHIHHIRSLGVGNVIVAGDFNHGFIRGDESKFYYGEDGVREYYRQTDRFDQYAYQMMKGDFADIEMAVHTPPGKHYSCGFEPLKDKDGVTNNGYLKYEHIITTNGLNVVEPQYSRQFMETHREQLEWDWNEDGGWSINPPFPDHAILTAKISFVDESTQERKV